MRVAFDAVILSVVLHPAAKYPKAIDRARDRVAQLIKDLEAANAKIVVPTPVLSEFLVLAGKDGALYLSEMTNSDLYEIQPFDTVAAVEAAAQMLKAMTSGDKKAGATGRWQVVKVDRQSVAIARVHSVTCIYSDDDGVQKLAAAAGVPVKGLADLPVPPPPEPETPSLFPEPSTDASTSNELAQPPAQSPGVEPTKA
jgi:hypothetical protein